MAYDSKIASARELVARHNEAAGEDEGNKVDFEGFVKELKKIGGTTEDALRACSWEDLEYCGLPRLLARAVAEVFRSRETEKGVRSWVTSARAERMTTAELLEAYDPAEADNSVGRRLAEIGKGKRCIVFTDDGAVDTTASLVLVEEIRNGFSEREFYTAEGDKPRPVFRVGERPYDVVEMNPLFDGHQDWALRPPNATCTRTGRSWKDIPQEVRVLLYIARKGTKELEIRGPQDAHSVLDRVDGLLLREQMRVSGEGAGSGDESARGMTFQEFRRRYPQASLMYDDLQQRGELPTLKGSFGGSKGVPTKDDPFFRQEGRHVQS